jgi:hypothetical protein
MKISQLKMIIREVVREEIRLGLKDIIGEIKQPIQSEQIIKKSKPPKKQNYSKNPILNEMLNETAKDEWETMGGTTFTSEKMNDVMGGAYSDLMNKNKEAPITVDGKQPDFLKKDYRELMKAVDKKRGKV